MKKVKPTKNDDVLTFPMRINRYLALKNYSTRRGADELIENKKVLINGKLAVLGDKVNEKDIVEVVGTKGSKKYAYFAYHKPHGIVTNAPQEGEQSIENVTRFPVRVFPIGRLDKESHGLIILTNDGRITKKLLEPRYEHEKEYEVQVNKPLSPSFANKMSKGVQLEDFMTKKCHVEDIDEKIFRITLTEGKKHQIRRMCTKFGYEVRELKRIRIMNIELGKLKPGEYREVTGKELTTFLSALGITEPTIKGQ